MGMPTMKKYIYFNFKNGENACTQFKNYFGDIIIMLIMPTECKEVENATISYKARKSKFIK